MVSTAEVENAYRLLLGREPENAEVVIKHAEAHKTLADLRHVFLTSEEFRTKVHDFVRETEPNGFKPLVWPKIFVEVEVSDELLSRMIARVQQAFAHLGETDPHWSVISNEKFRTANIGANEAEFFESGAGVVNDLQITSSRYGIDIAQYVDCFELGSGLGRSTIWLAKKFKKVIGADVSSIHIALCEQEISKRQLTNIQLLQTSDLTSLGRVPNFDVFFSIIVLQHNPPPLIAYILRIILSKLRPQGIAYFQVPTYSRNYSFVAAKYLEHPLNLGIPEMHVLPQNKLFELIEQASCRVLEIREDGAGGPNMISSRLLVQKKA
jgi:SAM-dependent methyltransferase